ncbi:MAG: RAD55 family ATPase [Candidatus Kariarchaeaceae archaeon]|jgi:KaiC/GvpD/RAD55 family RecA-like ATPase
MAKKKKAKKASFFKEDEASPDEQSQGSSGMFPPESTDQMQSPFPEPTPGAGGDQMAMFSQMMQSFQSMMNLGALPQQWSSSQPFQSVETAIEPEPVAHDIIYPKTLERGITKQEGLGIHPLYSKLFLDTEGRMLGGLPRGATITLTGPAYSGKTRSALEMIVNAVMLDIKVAYVVAEEGFYDTAESGRNDLFSRFLEVAVNITGMTEKQFRKKYDESYIIIPNQYHLGKTWGDFINDYRYAVEELECKLTIIDSINMLDPSKLNTVDNLNALKTYNHEKGITCVVIGQVKDSGVPQGGEALYHSSEVAIHIYEQTMTSKDLAARWGSNYRDSISLISARSKVCSTIPFPVRIMENDEGVIRAVTEQPDDHEFPEQFWDD